MGSLVIYLTTLMVIIGTASALKCYACNGFTCPYGLFSFTYPQVECEAKTGNSLLDTVASIIPTQCVKIVGKDENGSGFVARNCTPYSGQTACNLIAGAMELGSGLKELECYTCTDNLCNSAPQFTPMAVIGLIIACLAFYSKKIKFAHIAFVGMNVALNRKCITPLLLIDFSHSLCEIPHCKTCNLC